MVLLEFLLLGLVSLFVIINPLSIVPVFLSLTPHDTPQDRVRMVRFACFLGTIVLVCFALFGQLLFSVMGITLPAFQIAGGVLLSVIAFDMLRSPQANTRLTPEERAVAVEKDDIAISPLAVPLLCGPGAISTTILLQTRVTDLAGWLTLVLAIVLVYLVSYAILRISAHGADWLNPLFLRVVRRLMGLIFLAVAVQFILNGILQSGIVGDGQNNWWRRAPPLEEAGWPLGEDYRRLRRGL